MIVLPPPLRAALRANAAASRAARCSGDPEPDPVPLLKLFNPLSSATWLATELYENDDTLFGLADLGFGCPERGYFSLSEIGSLRFLFGTTIARDAHFQTDHPLSRWADAARQARSILGAGVHLDALARDRLPPPDPGDG